MTFEKLHVPGLSEDELVTLNSNAEKLDQKSRRNILRSAYYDGKHAVKQVGGVIPAQYLNLGLVLGWAAKGVDGLGRRCNLEKIIWADGDIDSLGMSALEERNFLFSEISQARTDSLIHGVSYLITTRGDESAGEPPALVHAKDALNAYGDWNVRTRELNDLLSVTSREDGKITGFVLYLNTSLSALRSRAASGVLSVRNTFTASPWIRWCIGLVRLGVWVGRVLAAQSCRSSVRRSGPLFALRRTWIFMPSRR